MGTARNRSVLITGGAGYLGSLLVGALLQQGRRVIALDDLVFGGQSLLPYWQNPAFRFVKANIATSDLGQALSGTTLEAVVHLAATVGFPACDAAGRASVWDVNVQGTRRVFDLAEEAGVRRFVFASTYSNYGIAEDGEPVTEASPLHPQSLYAESKIAAEEYVLDRARGGRVAPVVFRFATLFGVSPRTRFDLLINQFVLEALTEGRLVVYDSDYRRSFLHVVDAVSAICLCLDAPEDKVRGEVYNVGSAIGNCTKLELVEIIERHVPGLTVERITADMRGDMRDVAVSSVKIQRDLRFNARRSIEDGVVELSAAIGQGVFVNPHETRYRNAAPVVP